MRESGFYWVKRRAADSRLEVAEWSSKVLAWRFSGEMLWNSGLVWWMDETPIQWPAEAHRGKPAEPAPVTLADAVRVFSAVCEPTNYICAALIFDHTDGTVRVQNVGGDVIKYESVDSVERAFRAAIDELDRPPRKTIDQILRETK